MLFNIPPLFIKNSFAWRLDSVVSYASIICLVHLYFSSTELKATNFCPMSEAGGTH